MYGVEIKMKKGQISAFIIAGIVVVLLAAILGAALMKKNTGSLQAETLSFSEEKTNVELAVRECIENGFSKAVE